MIPADKCYRTISLRQIITSPHQPVNNHWTAGDLELLRPADQADQLSGRDQPPALHLPVRVEGDEVLGEVQVEHELRVGVDTARGGVEEGDQPRGLEVLGKVPGHTTLLPGLPDGGVEDGGALGHGATHEVVHEVGPGGFVWRPGDHYL